MGAVLRGAATLAALAWCLVLLLLGLLVLAFFVGGFVGGFVDGFRGARVEEGGARTAVVSAPVPVRRRD